MSFRGVGRTEPGLGESATMKDSLIKEHQCNNNEFKVIEAKIMCLYASKTNLDFTVKITEHPVYVCAPTGKQTVF